MNLQVYGIFNCFFISGKRVKILVMVIKHTVRTPCVATKKYWSTPLISLYCIGSSEEEKPH